MTVYSKMADLRSRVHIHNVLKGKAICGEFVVLQVKESRDLHKKDKHKMLSLIECSSRKQCAYVHVTSRALDPDR